MHFKTLIVVLVSSCVATAQSKGPTRSTAITFDDLPYAGVGQPDYLVRARRATNKIIRVLQSRHVPVVGFVNEEALDRRGEVEARTALLQQWIDSGAILGNHTYSHRDFNAVTVEQFEEEITKGEVVTRRLMRSHQPYQLYFRHPMTHTGDTQAKKEAIRKLSRGARLQNHTAHN